uniref:PHD-type domain-containing protein n=1 Tax=Anopheles farauti TaxID=69004 RepID=A0A182QMZ2_9DIPT
MSSQQYAQHVLKVAIAKICQAIGWDSTHVSAMDMLTDVTHHFLREICCAMHAYCEHYNRTEPNLDDLALAYKHVDINLDALKEYIEFVDPIPIPLKVPKIPLPNETNLNFPMTGSQEPVKRPAHIPEYMPPMPVVEEENAKALPTTIASSFSNIRELVEESEETTSCAEKIVVTSNAVGFGDEMCADIQTIEAKEPVIGETSPVEFETVSQDDEIQQRVQIEQVVQESVSVANSCSLLADDEAALTKDPNLNPAPLKEDYDIILPAVKGFLPVEHSSHFDHWNDQCTTVATTSGMSKKMINKKNKENKKHTHKMTTGATYSSSMLTNGLFSVEELRRRNKDKEKKHRKRDQLFVSPEPATVPVVPKLVLKINRTKVTESPSSETELPQTLRELKPINQQRQGVARSADTFDAAPTHVSNVDGNLLSICPACGRVEDDRPMIACDECGAWYDWECVGILVPPEADEVWYCPGCIGEK